MKQITDLPANDLWPIIFSNLSISDLFNCRLVNKQFKYFSDRTNGINKLIVGQPNSTFNEFHWYYNGKLIEDKDIISLKFFRSIKSILNSDQKPIFNLDKHLKYLKIYDRQLKLEELLDLINLESLEFDCSNAVLNSNQQIINLRNLKNFISKSNLSVELNTPKLEKIMFEHINLIELVSLESIKHLITHNYVDQLEIFQNLEIMQLRDSDSQYINENLLIVFKNLKQFKINLSFNQVDYLNDGIKNSLIKILNHKMKLRKVIGIYLEGVQIEKMDQFNELKECKDYVMNFRLNNYDLLDLNLSFINCLDYSELEDCFTDLKNDLPISFFDKFQNIYDVRVFGLKDVDGLKWFLNNLKYLTALAIHFNAPSLNQLFYNELPNSITHLYLYNGEDINYDFMSKLSKLNEFYTNVDKDFSNLIYTSFLNLKYFKRFFIDHEKQIDIKKIGEYFYLDNKKLNLNQLIKEYKKIRSK